VPGPIRQRNGNVATAKLVARPARQRRRIRAVVAASSQRDSAAGAAGTIFAGSRASTRTALGSMIARRSSRTNWRAPTSPVPPDTRRPPLAGSQRRSSPATSAVVSHRPDGEGRTAVILAEWRPMLVSGLRASTKFRTAPPSTSSEGHRRLSPPSAATMAPRLPPRPANTGHRLYYRRIAAVVQVGRRTTDALPRGASPGANRDRVIFRTNLRRRELPLAWSRSCWRCNGAPEQVVR
jgi:hypothetical protein